MSGCNLYFGDCKNESELPNLTDCFALFSERLKNTHRIIVLRVKGIKLDERFNGGKKIPKLTTFDCNRERIRNRNILEAKSLFVIMIIKSEIKGK